LKVSIVSVGIHNSGNLGSLARLCDNFDLESLILVRPHCMIDHRAYQRSITPHYLDNAIVIKDFNELKDYLDFVIGLTARRIKNLKRRNMVRNPLQLVEISKKLAEFEDGHIGIVLGPENAGLSNSELELCDTICTIPLPSENNVLNISHAATIVLYEIFKEKLNHLDHNKPLTQEIMSADQQKHLFKFFNNMVKHSKVSDEDEELTFNVFKSLLGRAFLNKTEAGVLIRAFRLISIGQDHSSSSNSS